MVEKKCHTCKHHHEWRDEIDGKLYSVDSTCTLEETCDDDELDYNAYYYYETKDDCKFYEKDDTK